MGRDHELEERFSENVDRMLAGTPVEPDPSMGDETREVQAFAQKMVMLRCGPSPEFQAQLKTRLLDKLNAETAGKTGWFERVWPRRLGWQAAAALAVLVIAFGAMWSTGVFRTSEPVSPALATATYLSVTGSTDKPAYRSGEQVNIQITLKNVSSESIDIGQFPPILSLMQGSTRQPVFTFVSTAVARTLEPEQSATFNLVWDQRDDKGRAAPDGSYYLELEDLDYQGQALKLNFVQTVRFDIKA